ncbi:MAG: hypothetical protein J3Q66DRAFT_399009 [Benniella sp.]|nr:MAG: hypothetical protein J3Q66DRAFT_399009 [Benniella sp.]
MHHNEVLCKLSNQLDSAPPSLGSGLWTGPALSLERLPRWTDIKEQLPRWIDIKEPPRWIDIKFDPYDSFRTGESTDMVSMLKAIGSGFGNIVRLYLANLNLYESKSDAGSAVRDLLLIIGVGTEPDSELIHNLWLNGELATFDKECYPNLRSLGIGFQSDDCLDNPVETISMDLIKTFPSLVDLHFGCVDLTPTAWMTLSSHPHIKKMELCAIPIRDFDAPAFWKVCKKLEHFRLFFMRMRGLTIPTDTVFHRMRHLEIEEGQQPDIPTQMDFILRCPSLV